MGHALKNVVMGATWALYDKDSPKESFVFASFMSHLFSYPILTAIRRI